MTQFAGKVYDHWKFRMKVVLDSQMVKQRIELDKEDLDETFVNLDKKCNSILIQCIADFSLAILLYVVESFGKRIPKGRCSKSIIPKEEVTKIKI